MKAWKLESWWVVSRASMLENRSLLEPRKIIPWKKSSMRIIHHRESRIKDPASRIEHQGSSIKHQGSSIEYPISRIEKQASRIENPGSSIENPASSIQHRDPFYLTALAPQCIFHREFKLRNKPYRRITDEKRELNRSGLE